VKRLLFETGSGESGPGAGTPGESGLTPELLTDAFGCLQDRPDRNSPSRILSSSVETRIGRAGDRPVLADGEIVDSKPAHPDTKPIAAPAKPEPIQLLRGDSAGLLGRKMESIVRDYAYRIYQNNSETHGRDLGHWVEAEAKLVGTELEVRESGPWFHCNCPVRGIPARQIQVGIDPTKFIIHLSADISSNAARSEGAYPIFYCAKWPEKVDPSTAAAYVLDANITIEVKKADPPEPNLPAKPVSNPIR
jgi:hypothetical protein